MSIHLHVRMRAPLYLNDLSLNVRSALQELLNCPNVPRVDMKFDESLASGLPTGDLITRESFLVVGSLAGYDESVVIMVFNCPVQVTAADGSSSWEEQDYMSVGWHFYKTALCSSFVAAAALAIARTTGSKIEDNAGYFGDPNGVDAEEFCSRLRLLERQTDLELAARALAAKMPKFLDYRPTGSL